MFGFTLLLLSGLVGRVGVTYQHTLYTSSVTDAQESVFIGTVTDSTVSGGNDNESSGGGIG